MSNSIYSISQSNSRCDFQSEEGENTDEPGAVNRVHHLVKEHCQCAYFRSQHYSKPSFFLAGTSVEKRSKEESYHRILLSAYGKKSRVYLFRIHLP
ncbi:conserved hypothetical protein [Ricinus communis]|uniref:Uncharacterized protein n=1 Tax=Ricinus communis TaxID=3988 RepID=B9TD21_RICCO|nr:conserved hypothetical protein [Ricinus communis]EEF26243.1 conserved hypothetical protein [Ricinus communis]